MGKVGTAALLQTARLPFVYLEADTRKIWAAVLDAAQWLALLLLAASLVPGRPCAPQ